MEDNKNLDNNEVLTDSSNNEDNSLNTAEETPVEENKVEENPVEVAPTEEASVEEVKVEEAPVAKNLTVDVLSASGSKVSDVTLNPDFFGVEVNEHEIYEAVKLYMANMRQATAKTKKRSEVSGGGKKPWRQKGTGRARAGSTRSPIWVGGGTVFGPKGVQNFKLEQNRKAHKLALHSALTLKVGNGLIVVDNISATKSKDIVSMLKAIKAKKALIVVDQYTDELKKATRNIKNVKLSDAKHMNVYDIMNANELVMTTNALKALEEVKQDESREEDNSITEVKE